MFTWGVGDPGSRAQSDLGGTGILKLYFPFLDDCSDHHVFGYFNI